MSISTASINNQLHVVTIDGGLVLHRIRELNGTWSSWGSIIPPEGHEFSEISCSGVGSALHILIKDTNGLYWHDIRHSSGRWQGIAQLPDQPLLNG